jgi:hypothetical protein
MYDDYDEHVDIHDDYDDHVSMYDKYDRDEAYDGHLEGCVDPTIDRGWTDRAKNGVIPARPAVDRRVVIIPVSKASPLHDTTQLSSYSLSSILYLISYILSRDIMSCLHHYICL